MRCFISFIYLCLAPLVLFSQQRQSVRDRIDFFRSIKPLEKVYAHTNKTLYTAGEIVYFTGYVTTDFLTKSTNSTALKVELVAPNGQRLNTQFFGIEQVISKGSIVIPVDAVGGIYKLRFSTEWIANFPNLIYEKEIQVMRTIAPRLLMKLDVEKESYGAGEVVNAELNIRDLLGFAIPYLAFDYEVKIEGISYLMESRRTDIAGNYTISFSLPDSINQQHVSLNVLFNYALNRESITRNVPILSKDIDLQFLPEGGFMLTGLPNQIAFKALTPEGNPADIEGDIYNSQGEIITKFKSFHQGMGKLTLTPEAKDSYYAKITSPYQSDAIILPKAKEHGFVINNVKCTGKQLEFTILSTQAVAAQLIVRTESKVFYDQKIDLIAGVNEKIVSTQGFPVGVLSLIVAQKDQIISERLVFNKQDEQLQIKIETEKPSYQTREKTILNILTTDHKNKPVPAVLSLSVTDDRLISYIDDKQHNILSWLLMGSSVRGKIHEPAYYFNPDENDRYEALDLVLLTHGWRNYSWENISKSNFEITSSIHNNVVQGRVIQYGFEEEKPYLTTVYVIADSLLYTAKTDKNGNFMVRTIPTTQWEVFVNLHKYSDQVYVRQIHNAVTVAEEQKTVVDTVIFENQPLLAKQGQEKESRVDNQQSVTSFGELAFEFSGDQEINEVVVVGSTAMERAIVTGYVSPNAQIMIDNISALSGRVSGIVASPSAIHSSQPISIRGMASTVSSNSPLFVVDGIALNSSNQQELSRLRTADINQITVLENAEATAMYGSRGVNGAVIISTDQKQSYRRGIPFGKYKHLQRTVFQKPQFYSRQKPHEFYYPKYENKQASVKDDFRNNVYWNYRIETNKDGTAQVSFYNADENTLYRVIAEGISPDGTVGRTVSTTYSVQDELSLDAKLPLYASQDDIISAPFWIHNRTDKEIKTDVQINAQEGIAILDFPKAITVEKRASSLEYVPFQIVKPADEAKKVRFLIEANGDRQAIIQELHLFEKGFPIEYGNSTTSSAAYDFEVHTPRANTQKLHLNLYLSPIQQIIDGLQRIVREPYGCFEQVSSSVYPNIYALTLLEQAKQSPELQQKSKKFLQQGYKKLIAYEVKGGGFDWFGRGPSSVPLSAFGLIEFIEMKPFVDVDQQMIERTKRWLLSKMDDKGSFDIYGWDRDKNSPYHLSKNAYVVYALSFAGVKEEIALAYQKAKEEALISKDLYRLSLMALAAEELEKEGDYEQLIHLVMKAVREEQKDSFKDVKTISGSYGKSIQNETLALAALALSKQQVVNLELVTCINTIIQNGTGGYFGSTQATGLALKAITVYYQMMRKSMEGKPGKVRVKLGDKELLNELVQENISGWAFNLDLPEGKHKIELFVENLDYGVLSYHFGYRSNLPPSSDGAFVQLKSTLSHREMKVGDNSLLNVSVVNTQNETIPMTVAKIGLPGGLSPEPQQLRDLVEKGVVDHYEIFNNFLVFYWKELKEKEIKQVKIDLKAQVPGLYTGSSSSTYLYYTEEKKHWNEGLQIKILP